MYIFKSSLEEPMPELAESLRTGSPYCEQFISSDLDCLITFRYRVWHCDGRQLASSAATSDALFSVCWQPRSEGFYPPPTVTPVVVSKSSVPTSQQEGIVSSVVYYYDYYYRKKRFRWRIDKRLQGHLTNTKDSDKTRVRRKVRTEYLSDEIVGRAVEIRKTSNEQFRLQLTSEGRK